MAVATLVVLLLGVVACCCHPESDFEEPLHSDVALADLEREGRDQYQQAVERISMPQSGTCWKAAVAALKDGCRQLDEKIHGELALRFSDCFLDMSGLVKHGCHFDDKQCLREMNQTAFDTYSKFYIHTQSMCYFLYNQAWHEETEKTIARLTTTSSKMSQQLQESVETQSKMMSDLLLVGTVLGKVSSILLTMQSLLFSGCSFFGTVLFFTAAAVAIAALGRTRSASNVVPHMFIVLFVGAIAESVLANWLGDDGETHYQQVWVLRCFEAIICTVLLGYAAWRYQRYGPANNKLLKMVDNKIDRVLGAVLRINQVRGPSQSACVKCAHKNLTNVDNTYNSISNKTEKSLPGMYEKNKREETASKQNIYSQSARESVLLRRSPVVVDRPVGTHWATTNLGKLSENQYPRIPRTADGLDQILRRTPNPPPRSPTPFADAQQAPTHPSPPPAPASPPPPYDYVDPRSKMAEDTTAPLTRRDFYTPDREILSRMEIKKAVVRIEPLKAIVPPIESQAQPQTSRRQTPTRKVRQSRSDSEQRTVQVGSEYSLRSHNRDAGSIA